MSGGLNVFFFYLSSRQIWFQMKYPQLVSALAVNAISDWLVTRLEQLGIDAPLVYSRLLLSLLHTPLQINALDLAEISDINVSTGVHVGQILEIETLS